MADRMYGRVDKRHSIYHIVKQPLLECRTICGRAVKWLTEERPDQLCKLCETLVNG